MNDTEMLDFVQTNVTEIETLTNQKIRIKYIYNGQTQTVEGMNLRDVVRIAMVKVKSATGVKPKIGFDLVNRDKLPDELSRSLGTYKAKWDGKKQRKPKKGEFYLSGAIAFAYLAPNDLTSEYFIAVPIKKETK